MMQIIASYHFNYVCWVNKKEIKSCETKNFINQGVNNMRRTIDFLVCHHIIGR